MNQIKYKTFLLTRVIQRNEYGTIAALINAIEKAKAISDITHWRDRKAAFNAIAEKAPMRTDVNAYCITHAELPDFLEQEWQEFNTFSSMTRGRKGADYTEAVSRFWQIND